MPRKLIILSFFLVILFSCIFQINYLSISKQDLDLRLKEANKVINDAYNSNTQKEEPTLLIGASKVNITPSIKTRVVGYSWRKEFEGVHDSLFVRSIVFQNRNEKTAIISFDLLLVTPQLKQAIVKELKKLGIVNIYLSATHTHSSFGGYGEDIIGKIILGGFKDEIFNNLINQTLVSINQASHKLDTISQIKFSKQTINNCLNRLTRKRNEQDILRKLSFYTEKEQFNIISSNSHPVILGAKNNQLSNDYPGSLMNNDTTFSLFLAGTMGSLAPIVPPNSEFKGIKYFTENLTQKKAVIDTITFNKLDYKVFDLAEAKETLFLNHFLKLRPWLFNLIIGKSPINIQTIRLGKILMIALPCEISFEYYAELEKLAKAKNLQLMLTTFNGSYLGYCTPSEKFEIDHMETREMNWMGPYGGDYFNKLIKMIIEKE